MAKEKEEPKPKGKEAGKGGKKKLHLKSIRSEQVHDGSIVHHHTYADSKEAPFSHPERQNMATSATPEEAGQHVAEQFGQNSGGQGAEEPEEAEGGEPEAGGAAGAAPVAGM
jgi:hypothetical protein